MLVLYVVACLATHSTSCTRYEFATEATTPMACALEAQFVAAGAWRQAHPAERVTEIHCARPKAAEGIRRVLDWLHP